MAYNRKKIFDKAKKVIVEENLVFIDEVIKYLPCKKTSFYDFFPANSELMNELKDLINTNKENLKKGLRTKWYESDNATVQLALYRLLATTEEHKLLNQSYIDQTSKGEKIDNKFEILIVNPNEDNQQEDK
jgi:hypothetical protein